jgi:hypothetical protein
MYNCEGNSESVRNKCVVACLTSGRVGESTGDMSDERKSERHSGQFLCNLGHDWLALLVSVCGSGIWNQ